MGVFSCGCAGSCVYVCEFLWVGGLVWVHGRVVVRARLVCRLVFVSVSGLVLAGDSWVREWARVGSLELLGSCGCVGSFGWVGSCQ